MSDQWFKVFIQESDLPSLIPIFCFTTVILAVSSLMVASALRIVPEYARMAIFRLGRFVGVRGPGLMFLLPTIDRGIQIDLREKKETINTEASTLDNTRLNIQVSLGYRIVEPEKSILNVPDVTNAVRETTRNRLKSIMGGMSYGDAIHERAGIEMELATRLGEALKAWGCEVISVELLEVQRS
jgi:regulator of protease activity HflC (stomatin/prohibitin superfamily)